jgi:plasmid stabilization system protein ParE
MPQSLRIRILPEAATDLAGIFDHIQQQSPQNAASVIEELINAIDSLSLFPRRYKVHRSARRGRRPVRSMPVPPFIVYYRIIEEHDTVEVMTVRHGAQRQPRGL